MSLVRRAIARDLKWLVKGKVLSKPADLLSYSVAACIFQIVPQVVVIPEDEEDVIRVVKYASRRVIPLTARGAGTSIAGQALGDGIIIDFSKSLNRIIEINKDELYAIVQPGIILDDLNRHLARYGLWLPSEPSSSRYCTVGGMIANNSGGMRSLKYGTTKDFVTALKVVFDDASTSLASPLASNLVPDARYGEIFKQVKEIITHYKDLIEACRPHSIKNSSGYNLYDIMEGGRIDICKLLCGSEGTLGIITQATFRLVKKPLCNGGVQLSFQDMDSACQAAIRAKECGASACEIMDKTLLSIIKKHFAQYRSQIKDDVCAIILCEFDGDDLQNVEQKIQRFQQVVRDLYTDIKISYRIEEIWNIRKIASPLLDRLETAKRPVRIVEDGAVPLQKLAEFVQGLQKMFEKNGIQGIIHGHAGDANLHVNVLLDPHNPDDHQIIVNIISDFCQLIGKLKGSLTGEHGDGILRARFLPLVFGPLYPVFMQIKKIFDPKNIFNPLKKICPADFDFKRYLRFNRSALSEVKIRKAHFLEIDKCNGCGSCRTFCPSFLATKDERHLPRSRLSIFSAYIYNRFRARQKEVRGATNSCLNCNLCYVECPAQVNVPGLCRSIDKTISPRISFRDKLLSEPLVLARYCRNPFFRTLPAKIVANILGLSNTIDVSIPEKFSFTSTFRARQKVIYIPGCFADYFAPLEEKLAIISVLEKQGFEVEVVSGICCGLPLLYNGERFSATKKVLSVIAALFRYRGFPVIFSQPSCAMMMKIEVPRLLAEFGYVKPSDLLFYDIHEFLHELLNTGRFNSNFRAINSSVAVHIPCHLKVIGAGEKLGALVSRIPGVNLINVDGCCGMAGTWGLKVENVGLSKKIAEPVVEQIRGAKPDFILSACGSCKLSLESKLKRKILHPITFLAYAYI